VNPDQEIIWYGTYVDNPEYKGEDDIENVMPVPSEETNLIVGDLIGFRPDYLRQCALRGVHFTLDKIKELDDRNPSEITLIFLGATKPLTIHDILGVNAQYGSPDYIGDMSPGIRNGRFQLGNRILTISGTLIDGMLRRLSKR